MYREVRMVEITEVLRSGLACRRSASPRAWVAKALYSLPRHFVGRTLRARADQQTVRLYDGPTLVKTHARQPPGGRSTDPTDFSTERSVYALQRVDIAHDA
jgi:hypothetical protein